MRTEFNPENKEQLTYGECLKPAMKITEQKDAQQYFQAYVEFTQQKLKENPRDDSMVAEEICKSNLGYFAGYYNEETMKRVNRLFDCVHPIFGSEPPSGKEAFEKGRQLGSTL